MRKDTTFSDRKLTRKEFSDKYWYGGMMPYQYHTADIEDGRDEREQFIINNCRALFEMFEAHINNMHHPRRCHNSQGATRVINMEELVKWKPGTFDGDVMRMAMKMFANMEIKGTDIADTLQSIMDDENIKEEEKGPLLVEWQFAFEHFEKKITKWLKANTDFLAFEEIREEREKRKKRLHNALVNMGAALILLGAGLLIGRFLF